MTNVHKNKSQSVLFIHNVKKSIEIVAQRQEGKRRKDTDYCTKKMNICIKKRKGRERTT